jgi:predicted amidohydrolase
LLKSRAIETQSIIIAVNRTGTDPDYTYGGYSAIYDAYGNSILEFDEKEQYGFASFDLTSVNKFRNQFDVLDDKWI